MNQKFQTNEKFQAFPKVCRKANKYVCLIGIVFNNMCVAGNIKAQQVLLKPIDASQLINPLLATQSDFLLKQSQQNIQHTSHMHYLCACGCNA